MIRLLFIALEFPPAQTTGMFRSLRFASKLHQHGIEPVVVTIDAKEAGNVFHASLNPKLLEQLPSSMEIHELSYGNLHETQSKFVRYARDWFRVSDGYYSRLAKGLRSLVASGVLGEIDAVYATLPPFGAGQLGVLAKQLLNRPLIIDMRDAWSQLGISPFRTVFHRQATRRLEKHVLGKADTIVTVTDPLGKMLQTLTPRGSSKIEVIPNAMDAPMKHDEIQWESKKETISVGYVGSFYFNDRSYEMGAKPWYKRPPHYWLSHYLVEQDWKYRTPFYFFKAWQALQKVSADSYNRMRFELVGDVPSWLPSMAKEMGVFDKCTFHGRMLKEEVNRLTEGFDFLLATSMKYVGGEDYCLASKTFDYVTSGKPVLGFVCDGAQRDFLRNSNVGVLFEPDDPDTNAKTMHECFQKDIILSPRMSFLSNFSANATTSQLASIIHRLVAERQS